LKIFNKCNTVWQWMAANDITNESSIVQIIAILNTVNINSSQLWQLNDQVHRVSILQCVQMTRIREEEVCPEKKWAPPPIILHWQVQTFPELNKIKQHALAQKYLSYCRQISYDSIIPFNRFSIVTNCCHRFQLPTWLAYYTRRTSLPSRMTSFCW